MADKLDLVRMRRNAAANQFPSEEEEGKAIAAELSDDPAEAEAQAGEWLEGEYPKPPLRDLRRPEVRSPLITSEGENYGGGWDVWPDMSVVQAASPEGGQTIEEARAEHEREVGDWPTSRRTKFMMEYPGYSEKLRKLMSHLSPEDQALMGWSLPGLGGEFGLNRMDFPPEEMWPLLRPEVRRVLEQEKRLQDEFAAEHERMRPRAIQKEEFEEEFPEEGGE